ncbi:MAG: N-acetyltransferase [Promethearchaeota archaeon]|nr:MAG: N-acetyltransferase [Candidatus Lokiarchaeota archaeon]
MNQKNEKSNVIIKTGNNEDIIELQMCANEFIEFIDDFEINLHNKKYFILTAYYFKNLSGILLAENVISKIDGLEKIVPKVQLIFLFVNPVYRNKGIANLLLNYFIKIQKKEKIASIYINLPQKYKFGKKFLEKYDFVQTITTNNNIILEKTLWYDFGIESCDFYKNRKDIRLNNYS